MSNKSNSSLWEDGAYDETNPFGSPSYTFPENPRTFANETQGVDFLTGSDGFCWPCFLLVLAFLGLIVWLGKSAL